jgi:hypothetical protein
MVSRILCKHGEISRDTDNHEGTKSQKFEKAFVA